jgi:hypothetical protein
MRFAKLKSNRRFIKAFSSVGRGFAAPSILDHVALPKFEEKKEAHIRLSELSIEATALLQSETHKMWVYLKMN